ncbi:hypothetical protein [Paenibacillus guangzhouensis]|uniref:hypothetical protein n=1 Tax=Paenibacillus guangzhouensis TaxID=1473112 RepID=UPI00126745D4|nr:hypothetical protein [Paenibacillus guangzhouensis]
MEQQVVIRNPADIQWFGLNKDGSIAYSKHGLDGMSAHKRIKASAPISSFCMLQNNGSIHILADTTSGMYYIKVAEHSRDQKELRVAANRQARFPYLFIYKSVLYVCCVVTELEESKLFLKSLDNGVWNERYIPLFRGEGALVRLDDAVFTISNQGKLHGLFRCLNPLDECVLYSLEYDVEQDVRNERRLFALKQKNQRWHMGLDVDCLGMPHFVWTILNGGSVAYYYVNAAREARSSMPLLINGDQDAAIPHFLFANECILVLFWDGNEKIEYVYSLNQGRTWSASGHIHFGKQSSLRMVQSIRKQSTMISPAKVLGFHMPFFRSLEFIDLFNPFIGLGFSASSVERFHWIKLQMEYLYRDYLQHTNQLRQEASKVALLNEAMEDQVRSLMREVDQLKEEEKKVLEQLKAMNEMKEDEEEHFSLRFIR